MADREKTHQKTKGTNLFHGPYHEWFERAPAGYFILDRSGEITDVNQTGLSLLGWPSEQVAGKSFSDFVVSEDRGHFSLHLYEVTNSGQTSCYHVTLVCSKGRRCDVELRSTPTLDATGKRVTGCLTLVSDATEQQDQVKKLRRLYSESESRHQRDVSDLAHSSNFLQQEVFNHEQTEAILAQTSELFEKVFSTSYLAIACLDCEFNYLRVNPVYAQAYEKSPGFFLDKPYFDLYPHDELKADFARVLVTGVPYVAFAVPFVIKDGDNEMMTWWDWHVSTLVDRDGRVEGLLLCLVDVSARIRLEHKIVHVTDQEQKRLGQELHDGMGQLLTAISIKNKILEEIIREKIPEVAPHVQEVGQLIREAAVQTRNLSKLLNPRIVEVQGLVPALGSLATETQRHLGVSCRFTWDEPLETLDPVVAGHLFRMAQESVTNALRHGPAQNIRITFNLNDGIRTLRIVNDGRPFDPQQAAQSDGVGVHGMRYRAEIIGASYRIAPGPDEGTVVTCTLPKPEIALNMDTKKAD